MDDIYKEYDSLIICGVYEGNLVEIARALNGFLFDQDAGQSAHFVVHNGRIKPKRSSVSPLVRLSNWETHIYYQIEEVSLDRLSQTIAPLLTRGTLELVAINTNGGSEFEWDRFAIYSEGWFQIEHNFARSGIYLLEYLYEDYRGYEFDLDDDLHDDLEVVDNVPNKVAHLREQQ